MNSCVNALMHPGFPHKTLMALIIQPFSLKAVAVILGKVTK
uniref:Uncharacterized protein n=1 Tax=Anguilla anguilla TaxID=7936 RepID=A0A0E9WCU4_ANGAN